MYSNEMIADFLTLRSQGLSYDKISEIIHVSKHTLLDWAKEYRPPIDQKLQTALETYHATIAGRVESLAKQFQTITHALTTCDPTGSRYPRLVGLLLKLHQALLEFDFTPGSLSEDSTKTAPTHDSEPERTETAPESDSELSAVSCELSAKESTISAPESISSLPIQNPKLALERSEGSKIQNLPPHLKRIQDKIDRLEAKIAS